VKKKYKIYGPKPFVKLLLDGTPHTEVARSAYQKVQERLLRLGKIDANVLGRKLDIED
jgi:hypothetical protein